MISKVLSVAALAGIAAASCPLSVEISGITGHIVHVVVTNTGNESLTVFKGNTVLSDHPTRDLVVSDVDDDTIQFQGVAVNYRRAGISSSMFQIFQPGETVTSFVNVAKTYQLTGITEAQVTALQGFNYVTGATAPTALKEMEICQTITSNTVSIVPDQSKVAADKYIMKNVPRSSRIKGRDVTFDFCSDDQVSQLQTAVNDATSMAGAARDNAPSGNFFYSTWFRDNSQLDKVTSTFSQVTDVPGMGAGISCADPGGFCVDQIIAYTNQPRGPVVPCPLYFNSPALAGDCQGTEGNGDKGGVLLHEFTHLGPALTTDIAYRMEDCRQLSAEDAAINANSYRIYASSVRLGGCS